MKTKNRFLILGYLTFALLLIACSSDGEDPPLEPTSTTKPTPTPAPTSADKRETFTFSSNGTSINGKIFVPSGHEENKDLPAIYLIDFTEQHFQVATDEFERVIAGVKKVKGLNALVITLEKHWSIDFVIPRDYQEYSDVYKNWLLM